MCSHSKDVHYVHFFTSIIFINLDFLLLLNMLVLKNTLLLHENTDIFNFFFNYDQTYWPIFNVTIKRKRIHQFQLQELCILVGFKTQRQFLKKTIEKIKFQKQLLSFDFLKTSKSIYKKMLFYTEFYLMSGENNIISVGDRITPMTCTVALHLASNDITLKKMFSFLHGSSDIIDFRISRTQECLQLKAYSRPVHPNSL